MFFSSTFNRLLGSILIAMVIAALAAYSILTMRTAEITKTMPTNISVTGEGTVKVKPDIAQFSFSVTAKGATAEEAQSTSSVKMTTLTQYLAEQGVTEADIKTENYNLYPLFVYEYEEGAECRDWNCPGPKEIQDGFEVSQYVTVKVRDMAKAGALLAGVGERGATGISGLNFVIDNDESSKIEARNKAIADARAEAQNIANQFGMKLVRMTGYYEMEDYYAPEPAYGSYEMDMAKNEAGGSPPLPAGEQEITATVNVSYEME
jgi:uncharacterized protein YggE